MWRNLIIAVFILLAGCKTDLYTGLTERDANEMLAILMSNGIPASKVYLDDERVNLQVQEAELPRAIDALKQNGYPKESRKSIGKVFEKSGIISSPFEERVRFVYALGEEVSKTLSEIDGVLTARVHVVLPEAPELGEEVKPSSSAVFIKHRAGVDLDFFTPQIRRLVSNSIEGVDFEDVTVILVEAEKPKIMTQSIRTPVTEVIPGLGVRESDSTLFWQLLTGIGALLAILLGLNIYTAIKLQKTRKSAEETMNALEELQQVTE